LAVPHSAARTAPLTAEGHTNRLREPRPAHKRAVSGAVLAALDAHAQAAPGMTISSGRRSSTGQMQQRRQPPPHLAAEVPWRKPPATAGPCRRNSRMGGGPGPPSSAQQGRPLRDRLLDLLPVAVLRSGLPRRERIAFSRVLDGGARRRFTPAASLERWSACGPPSALRASARDRSLGRKVTTHGTSCS